MKVVWAEKHRPTKLGEFKGQEHLRAEMNAILGGRAHMQHFIFYSREPGTGKTTLAYLLANTLGYQIHNTMPRLRNSVVLSLSKKKYPLSQGQVKTK